MPLTRPALLFLGVVALATSGRPAPAQRHAPSRFADGTVRAPALAGSAQVRVARNEISVRRGMVIGGVIGGGALVAFVVVEDMFSGDLLEQEPAASALSPRRILAYTAIGAASGALIGGGIAYWRKKRAAGSEAASSARRPSVSRSAGTAFLLAPARP